MTGKFCLAALLASLALGAAAQPADVAGWRDARWGMDEAQLEAAFGDLEPLPGRWDYGGAYATRWLRQVEVAGLGFRAMFQMNEESGRLQQVLLERLGYVARPGDFLPLVEALEAELGPPSSICPPDRSVSRKRVEVVWAFPTTTVHVVFFDFRSPNLIYEDPVVGRDSFRPSRDFRRIVRRTLPRRVLVRYHATARDELLSGDCRPE